MPTIEDCGSCALLAKIRHDALVKCVVALVHMHNIGHKTSTMPDWLMDSAQEAIDQGRNALLDTPV